MSQELSRQDISRPDSSPGVRKILDDVENYVEDHQERERSLLQKVLPNRQQRHIDVARRKAVRAHYEHQSEVLQIAHEAKIQEIKEIYNDFLVKGKTKIRKEQAEFFQGQLENLLNTVSLKSQDFGERLSGACERVEKLSVDFLRERQEELIRSIVDDYYGTVDTLIKNFRKILDEQIQNPGPTKQSALMD